VKPIGSLLTAISIAKDKPRYFPLLLLMCVIFSPLFKFSESFINDDSIGIGKARQSSAAELQALSPVRVK